jgi:quinol monooxygenase YgiN
MTNVPYRAIAVLTPKSDGIEALVAFTLGALPTIRAVAGLVDVEASRSLDGPARLFLYYWWTSPTASADYMNGPVYAELGPALDDLVDDHMLIVGERLD